MANLAHLVVVIAVAMALKVGGRSLKENNLTRDKRAVGSRPDGVYGTCGGEQSGNAGYIASPNFPNSQYPSLSACNWTVAVDEGMVVKFSFMFMDMEDGPVQKLGNCGADSISIYDENNPDLLIGKQRFCGHDTVFKPVFSVTNTVGIDFESDETIQRSGFVLKWEAVAPPRVMLNCDFEANSDLCFGWSQRSDDDFDWMIRSGSTPSGRFFHTGPRYDHTFGSGGEIFRGFYAYIEASGKLPNDKAILSSPPFDLSFSQYHCLSFWYHMRGSGVGSLALYQVSLGQPLTSGRPIFEKSGAEGDIWIQEQVDISSGGEEVQFMFVGIRGNNFRGDVAIDDIMMTDTRCK